MPRGEREPRAARDPREPREERARELRFYLDADDPVVDAPTVGPRTAERLHKVGIRTVRDLISADPELLAAEIDYKRISADDIRSWQQQSVLACRIPQIRGHDAQILVACGVTDPDKLASMSANELWGIVQPFTKTAECKRIVRNGKGPDLEEIQDWINWAKSARTLQAA
jgi:hypothetical protein